MKKLNANILSVGEAIRREIKMNSLCYVNSNLNIPNFFKL